MHGDHRAAAGPLVVADARVDARVARLPPVTQRRGRRLPRRPAGRRRRPRDRRPVRLRAGPADLDRRRVALLEQLAGPVVAELELAALSADTRATSWSGSSPSTPPGIGAFDLDLATGTLRWDDRLLVAVRGRRRASAARSRRSSTLVHPDDVARVRGVLSAAVERAASYAVEHRLLLPGRPGALDRRPAARRCPAPDGRRGPRRRRGVRRHGRPRGRGAGARACSTRCRARVLHLDRDWRVTLRQPRGRAGHRHGPRASWSAASCGSCSRRPSAATSSGSTAAPSRRGAGVLRRLLPAAAGRVVRGARLADRRRALALLHRRHRPAPLGAAAGRHRPRATSCWRRVTDALTGTLDGDEAASRLAPLLDRDARGLVPGHAGRRRGAHATGARGLRDAGFAHADPEQRHLVERYAAAPAGRAATTSPSWPGCCGPGEPLVVAERRDGEGRGRARRRARPATCSSAWRPSRRSSRRCGGRGRTVGLLSAFRGAGRPAFSREARDTLVDVADRAGLALDNARLYARAARPRRGPAAQPDDRAAEARPLPGRRALRARGARPPRSAATGTTRSCSRTARP